jgi:hypothetical protein
MESTEQKVKVEVHAVANCHGRTRVVYIATEKC